MVCNSCLRVASPLAKSASTQSQWRVGLELASRRRHNARTAPRRPRLDTSQSYFYDCELHSKSVLSGVPHGSVLGPILFLVYINDLEEGVTGKILLFADNTKLLEKTKEIGDKQTLQDDIDKWIKWCEKWQILFNFGKCKCLHTEPEILAWNMKWEELFWVKPWGKNT